MNEREAEIKAVEEQQNKTIHDRIEARLRILRDMAEGYAKTNKDEKERMKVDISKVPEAFRNNPYFLLRAGFAGLDSDEQTKKTVIDPKSEASDDPQGDDAFNKNQ